LIVIDTSALMAIAENEDRALECMAAANSEATILIAAPTLTEVLVVAGGRGIGAEMHRLIDGIQPTVIPLTEGLARAAAEAYGTWGKGFHPAKLNLGDCFAYATAKAHGCPLLYIGDDFAQTDIESAIA